MHDALVRGKFPYHFINIPDNVDRTNLFKEEIEKSNDKNSEQELGTEVKLATLAFQFTN